MRPILKIGNQDFTELVASLAPSNNDLDADGAGRDISDGELHRKKVADKDKLQVGMLRLWEEDMVRLHNALNPAFVQVTYLRPGTNTQVTKTMYCSSLTNGLQMFKPSKNKTYYEGATFELVER